MNTPSEDQIEKLLRLSPTPAPPRGLKERLIMQTQSVPPQSTSAESLLALAQRGWWRRWWPALVPAGLSLLCMAVIAAQQIQIRQLKQSIEALTAAAAPPAPTIQTNDNSSAIDSSADDAREIARLKQEVGQLAAEIAQLEKLRAENQSLREQLAAPLSGAISPEDARDKAERAACVNNLKQINIAARVFAGDVGGQAPPDFLSMSNELGTAKILVCPGDHGRQVAPGFSSFTAANCSYEYLLEGGSTNWVAEPTRVMTRCPIHGTIGLCDGSVQMINTNGAQWFVQRDGKLYWEPPAQR